VALVTTMNCKGPGPELNLSYKELELSITGGVGYFKTETDVGYTMTENNRKPEINNRH